ncbi:MAG: sulfide/dihydroorotate dehydrogenase-like FAD/NAD-binding protein [Oscillospiraceae bacterium]|nr:sulfide/dihydroorotate dehydrogenase-like FAD/NAD-binding protein [Oscillospiraceae bacterium]
MYKVVKKRFLNDAKTICLFEIEAPLIARHAQAGQFVVFRLDEQGERVPVSVAGYDREKGTVSVMVQAAGRTTKMLHTVEEGDVISDIVGPLGKATEMEGLSNVCVVGGGVGCAIAYPIAKEMHERGIQVTFIAGFRSADIVILKEELKAASDKLIICTDDGSYGEKGFTTVFLKNEIEANIAENKPQFDRVIAIGPDIMMKFLADVTRPYGISTIISLDPIMVDGTGMCGCCRVIVGGETKFACVDGPDFDAHQVDFDSLIKRAAFYQSEQEEAAQHICRMTGGKRNG